MKITSLHIGMQVRHPQYGVGMIKALNEHTAEVRFDDMVRTIAPEACGLQPAEATVTLSGLEKPLAEIIRETVADVLHQTGLEKPDLLVEHLGARWHGGRMVLHPADPTVQTKEVPLEVFFHKVVMVRNQLRVLEQKINAHPTLTDGEKVEMQQYITRCYGSFTTFNLLFRSKADQFGE